MKKKLSLVCLLAVLIALPACGTKEPEHKHKWIPQTCTEPLICTECGAVKGEPDGHKWVEATCSNPKTCLVCGATEGDTLPHTWEEATVQSLKTCLVCGSTEGEYKKVSYEIIDKQKALYPASDYCIVFEKGSKFGVINSDGDILVDSEYDGFITGLQNDWFSLYKEADETVLFDLFDSECNLVFSTKDDYAGYSIVGMSGGYLTLSNAEDGLWIYLNVDEDFDPAAFVDANTVSKESFSVANRGYAASKSIDGSLGYPYFSLIDNKFLSGELGTNEYIDARGCAVNDNGNLLVSHWTLTKDHEKEEGTYELDGCGFYNVLSNEYISINGFDDDTYSLRHIFYNGSTGISGYDCVGNYMLLKTKDTYNLYDYVNDVFVTDYGLEEVYIGENYNIGAVMRNGALKYSFLDSDCNLTGKLWDELTYFNDGLAMGLENGKAYFINAELGIVSDEIEALHVSHKYSDYFIIEQKNSSLLVKTK